ncbi:MAG: ChaN family lipoprotein [Halothiobacillaceae bacterium]
MALLLVGLFGTSGVMAEDSWQAQYERDHPLVGGWLDARGASSQVDPPAPAALAQSDVILLGEVHGHPDHHPRQLQIIRWLQEQGRDPALAFEIFDRDDQPVVARFLAEGGRDADQLAERLGMAKRGWPWASYRPLVQHALDQGLAILPLNLSREDARLVMREGLAALRDDALVETAMKQAAPFTAADTDAWSADVVDAHCGHIGQEVAQRMVFAQQVRDAVMAANIARAEHRPVVVITGAEHARRDRGIAHWLSVLKPDWRVATVGMRPVLPDARSIEDYRDVAGRYDWVWLTPRQYDEDPCERMKRQLEQLKKGDAK